ncbi:pyridoxal phosphate-dependent aminotransferase [Aquimarina macrocephali]|uniref:pyridoxal phosphate-dependent aminotransferase n=1 Tax=Aquimarina macrocephali TaxID=666563 RepID=UPI0004631B2F|nr:aminotransferase class I/II-fold pyridoxal phosphate-dependent enzyme [Aquimarina macrocephali]
MIYGHGDDGYRYAIPFKANFSSNIWHDGTSEQLLSYLREQLPLIANYPAPNADVLTQQIADHHGLNSSQVVITNGATEAFYSITPLFSGKKTAIGIPTFSEYEDACLRSNMKIKHFDRSEVLHTSFEEDLVFLCNPNNPDGFSNTVLEIEKLIADFPDTTFVVDEAYIDFTDKIKSCIELLEKFANLIIIKSLTKLFSIPGLRLGYILCSTEIGEKLQHSKIPWSVNTMAIEAGKYIFKNYKALYPDMATLLEYSNQLQQQINTLDGFTVIPSDTNYFVVKLETPSAPHLKDYLAHTHQLLIRDASNFRGLGSHYIRIASQNPEKNELLIRALQQWSTQQ